jgi:hypothetical protein
MKNLLYFFLSVSLYVPHTTSAQDGPTATAVEVIPFEKLASHQLGDAKVDELSELSKNHVVKSSESQITAEEIELLDVELVYESDPIPLIDKSPATDNKAVSVETPLCFPQNSDPINKLSQQIDDILKTDPPKKKRYIYFTWGYNRGFHSKSDATFTTKDGTFTIHDAVGYDRPSKDWKDYVYPERIPIPQYNLRIGYQLNEKWDIVAGLDHMKWVFDNNLKYEISGDYNHTLFVPDPSGDPALLMGKTFDEVKQTGDARWLSFEHTNGYNYAHLGAVYKTNLFTSKNGDFKIETGLGAGAGLMIPQTTVKYHQDSWWNWKGVDNNFHIAGFGAHAEAKVQFSYKNFFLEPVVRGTYIKVSNALVQNSGERLEHTPIGSIQFIVQGGYKIPIKERKKRTPSSIGL